MSHPPFGVVIPIRNESAILHRTVPAMLEALGGLPARVIWVCNGCSDGSAEAVAALAGDGAEVHSLDNAGKTVALQHGDDLLGALFPRFYVDGDVTLSRDAFPELLHPLLSGVADLVSPRRTHDTDQVPFLSAAMARSWETLPFAQQAGFVGVLGVSAHGRARWGRWPDLLCDDLFVCSKFPEPRKLLLSHITARTRPPSTFYGWVRMRARWLHGERQLRSLGLRTPNVQGQRVALLRQMAIPDTALGAWALAIARVLAQLIPRGSASEWRPDRAGEPERGRAIERAGM